jgi:hypothetical protein
LRLLFNHSWNMRCTRRSTCHCRCCHLCCMLWKKDLMSPFLFIIQSTYQNQDASIFI